MLFNSFQFIFVFLPITLGIALKLRGNTLLSWLTIVSYVFYALTGQIWFLIPMFTTTALDFYLAQWMESAASQRCRRLLLLLSLCGNLGLLISFKYTHLFLQTSLTLFHWAGGTGAPPNWFSLFDIALPAGISFYTFQTLSYMIDVYHGQARAERNFWKFASFVSFFPHLVAGPLTRHHQLIPPLEDIAQKGISSRWEEGIFLFSIGLCKKTLLADRIAEVIDPALVDIRSLGFATAWLALLGYSFQIYFDFSGYSDMAIGLGRLFGVELPQNFNSPYQALNPSDFWRRWHMTLSQWLRDYLYIGLGGNRGTRARQFFNVMLTMFIGGLWHGASWTFAIWGTYHGLLLVLYHLLKDQWDRWPRVFQRALMFFLICIGWVFFRARNAVDMKGWMAALMGAKGLQLSSLDPVYTALALLVILSLFIVNVLPNASSYKEFPRLSAPLQIGLGALTVLAMLFMNYSSKFLYYQF